MNPISRIRTMLRVQDMDAVLAEIATGEVPGAYAVQVNGYNPAVTAVLADICELGVGVSVPLPAGAIPMELVSSHADDIMTTGDGAWEVEIHGLVAGYIADSEIIELNGVTPVPTTKNFIRVNNLHVMSAGVNGLPTGDITLRALADTPVYSKIAAGGNMCLQAHYTVPAGKIGYIHEVTMGATTTQVNTIARALFRAKADWSSRDLTSVFLFERLGVYQKASLGRPVRLWYPSMCDIKVSAQTVQGAAASVASAEFNVYVIDQDTSGD